MTTSIPTIIHPASAGDENPDTCSYSGSEPPGSATAPLTPEEQETLATCEEVRDKLKKADDRLRKVEIEAGHALETIFQLKLYRAHGTFDDYCKKEWQIGADRAGQLRRAARVVDALAERGVTDLPQNEAQARHLAANALSIDEKVALWNEALSEEGTAAKLSKQKVRRVVEKYSGKDDRKVSADHAAALHHAPDPDAEGTSGSRIDALLAQVPKLKKVSASHLATLRAALLLSFPDGDPSTEDVAEAAEIIALMRNEGGHANRTVVVGDAVEIVDANRALLSGQKPSTTQVVQSVRIDIPLGMVGILDEPLADPRSAHAPRLPLLVVIPKSLCPTSLIDAHEEARPAKPTVTDTTLEVVVLISELHRYGGPVESKKVNGETLYIVDLKAVREASKEAGIKHTFNKTGKLVGWARFSTNPLTGCSHACSREFCYASDLALWLYPQCFVPTIHPARLDAFSNTALPDDGETKPWAPSWDRSVFLGSMGDLFNNSFPDWWIQAVLDEIAAHPHWNVFLLTKLPPRLKDFVFPQNAAVGVTVVGPEAVQAAARGLAKVRGGAFKWISVEPYLKAIDAQPLLDAGATLFAVGGRSRTRWSGEMQPDPVAVRDLIQTVYVGGGWVYFKDNLDSTGHVPFTANVSHYTSEVPDQKTGGDPQTQGCQSSCAGCQPAPDRPAVPARGPKGSSVMGQPVEATA